MIEFIFGLGYGKGEKRGGSGWVRLFFFMVIGLVVLILEVWVLGR